MQSFRPLRGAWVLRSVSDRLSQSKSAVLSRIVEEEVDEVADVVLDLVEIL